MGVLVKILAGRRTCSKVRDYNLKIMWEGNNKNVKNAGEINI